MWTVENCLTGEHTRVRALTALGAAEIATAEQGWQIVEAWR